MVSIPKGTKDVLPEESYKWHFLEEKIGKVTKQFGFDEIRTPVFEHTELFLRGVGDTTDIVNKEMYTFDDKGGRSITLKPEGTAGIARSFIENSLINNAQPTKMYYITPVFRYERPQAGRLREHHQFGVELYGSQSAYADAEVISLAKTFFDMLGLKNLSLHINSIGCENCRKEYSAALVKHFSAHKDKLCENCLDRLTRNPLRVLDCKVQGCKEVAETAPRAIDYLCDDCKKHHEKLCLTLTNMGINFVVDPKIVRGLDYYTRTVFEFISEQIGSQGTVCGGGRYNKLVKELGGDDVPAVGFGMGLERLMLVMESEGIGFGEPNVSAVYIAPIGEEQYVEAQKIVFEMRKNGISVQTDIVERSLKAQMKFADKKGFKYVVVLGEDEVKNNKVTLKNLATKDCKEISIDELKTLKI